MPGFDATTWYGLVAPAGTPRRIVEELYHLTAAALENPEARKIMGGLGIDVVGNSPREFDAYINAENPQVVGGRQSHRPSRLIGFIEPGGLT